MYWAVPHHLVGAQQAVLEPGDWRCTIGSLSKEDSTVANERWPPHARFAALWAKDQFEGLMDAGFQTNEATRRLGALQAAC